ncbi:MAG: hypothetical protein H0U23_12455 [Blastocatellia bacterium]|nr:hypothetical protein [Blastocatellia bacterium]
MNDPGIWTRGLTYGATLVVTPLLLWALARAFPARQTFSAENHAIRSRHQSTETWSAIFGIVAAWLALAVMLAARVGNTPWLVGVILGWVVLAPVMFIAARTLPRGVPYWREFWRFHETHSGIDLRLLAPVYAFMSLLGIVSTFVLVARQ